MQLLATCSIGFVVKSSNYIQELKSCPTQTFKHLYTSFQNKIDLHVLSIDCSVQIEIMFALAQEFYKQYSSTVTLCFISWTHTQT